MANDNLPFCAKTKSSLYFDLKWLYMNKLQMGMYGTSSTHTPPLAFCQHLRLFICFGALLCSALLLELLQWLGNCSLWLHGKKTNSVTQLWNIFLSLCFCFACLRSLSKLVLWLWLFFFDSSHIVISSHRHRIGFLPKLTIFLLLHRGGT